MGMKAVIWDSFTSLPGWLLRPIFNSKGIMRLAFGGRFSLNHLDEQLEKFVGSGPGFFVEIGGNDGFSQSNSKYFELYKNWTGILVEPHEGNWRKSFKTRKNTTHKVHAACVPFTYTDSTVELIYSNLMTVSSGLRTENSDDVQHAEDGARWLRSKSLVKRFRAPARTLTSILDDCNAPKEIDIFSLDVEGAELSVLDGLDHDRYRFSNLLVETSNFERVRDYLAPKGYRFHSQLSGHDYLFVSEEL